MSEPRTFEEHLKAWTERDLDFHVLAGATGIEFGRSCWEASDKATRAALLADRPDVAGAVSSLRLRSCGCSFTAIPVIESLAAQLAEKDKMLATMYPFWTKHALGGLSKPSCLCCGRNDYEKVGVKHAELPDIVICSGCHTAATKEPTR